MRGIHVRLNLEDKARERVARGRNFALIAHAAAGRRGELQKAFEEGLHAEIGDG